MSGWPQIDDKDDGWDLFAVVRSCRVASRPSPANPLPENRAAGSPNDCPSFFPNLTASVISHGSKPYFAGAPPLKVQSWPCSAAGNGAAPSTTRRPGSQSMPRSKRRRSQQKRVVRQVPADGLAADMWAWRKYGQKPIKGSPYPRGYYRCSSSKGCLARKQVERSRTDAGMFVITYTGEHNHPVPTHRNSLAGSTRQKFSGAGERPESSPNTPLKRTEEDGEEEEEDDGEDEEEDGVLLVEDMEVVGEDEVLFTGLAKFENSPPAADGVAGSSPATAGVSPRETDGENLFDFERCLGNWIL